MLADPVNPNVRRHQTRIMAAGVVFFLVNFAWETVTSQEGINVWALVPLALGVCLMDRRFELPLISEPVHLYHLLIVSTLVILGPSSATLVGVILATVLIVRTYFRSRYLVTAKLLSLIPALLSIWILSKLYHYIPIDRGLMSWGTRLPGISKITGYYLLCTFWSVAIDGLFESVNFLKEWKQRYFVSTMLFLSFMTGIGLISHSAQYMGAQAYLLAIPLGALAITTYKIYSENSKERSHRLAERAQLQMSIIETLALAIDAKHQSTHGHVRRVQTFATGIAKSLGIEDNDELAALKMATLLHDIGKLAIPEYILSKPGKLSELEYAKMIRHVEVGTKILEPIHFPYPVVPIIRHHHERYNGTGYPSGLKGNEIPLGARILSVADTFDALTAYRPYRNPRSVSEAIALIEQEAGTSYDPEVVKAFLRVAHQLASEVARLEVNDPGDNSCMLQSEPDSPEERKAWQREKSLAEITSTHREIYTLYEIFQAVGNSLNARETMGMICDRLKFLVPFSSCVIYLKTKKTNSIHPAMVVGDFAEQLKKNWISLGEGLTGYAMAFNQRVLNTNPATDFQNMASLEKPHQLINSMIFPLISDNDVFGAIALYSSARSEDIYSEDHVRLMETISPQAAISIHNALSFESFEEHSLTDPLTGLPNSRFMIMAFEQNVEKAARFKEKMAILVMDLNHFKLINDQFGHKAGDEVLIKVSEILQREMRKYDTCVRYAGDEFVAILYDADREMAEGIVARIKKSVQVVVVGRSGKQVRMGISVGMSMYPDDGPELNQLFTVADSQMYNDKFESKAENAQQNRGLLKEAIVLEDDIQFQRVN